MTKEAGEGKVQGGEKMGGKGNPVSFPRANRKSGDWGDRGFELKDGGKTHQGEEVVGGKRGTTT